MRLAARTRLYSLCEEMTVHDHVTTEHGDSASLPHSSTNTQIAFNRERQLNYARLLQYNACYEAMPTSSKMVVFDTQLTLKKAFNGLIYQNTRHVLLSDSEKDGAIVGLLSVTDFIRVMLRLYKNLKDLEKKTHESEGMEFSSSLASTTDDGIHTLSEDDIGRLTLKEYRELIQTEGKLNDLVYINADECLLQAVRMLSKHRIHRLPVMDPISGSPLFILTHKRILKFLWLFGQSFSTPDYHEKSCKQLGIGTWTGIRVVFPDTPIVDCFDILLHKGVSGLPVVERHTYKVIDMYSRFDAIGVALEDRMHQLDITVEQALEFRNSFRSEDNRVVSILDTDCLWTALTVLVQRNVHRLCAIRKNGAIEGLISLSDVINYMVVKPGSKLSTSHSCHRHLYHNNSMHDDFERHSILNRLGENSAILEQQTTNRLNHQLATFTMK